MHSSYDMFHDEIKTLMYCIPKTIREADTHEPGRTPGVVVEGEIGKEYELCVCGGQYAMIP